ncbi:MAG TPA: MFS transporter [Methylomirabilota bacterium]|jgi:maltose/moltooligosaccharide transporter
MSARPHLGFWQIWNMAFGFLGIQFGWALQMANMSAIYEYLGADAHQIPMLWLAAPLTGLLVQPIIGHLSDRTWNRLGRRRPYFLAGALLASFALIAMPHSSTLWMAAGLLWIMDASINISMEPFRAFVADLLPPEQRTRGYAMQALFIGLGAVIASMLPWLLYGLFPPGREGAGGGAIPLGVRLAFYMGAVAFLIAVLWTIFTTREHPPEDMDAFRRMKAEKTGVRAAAVEIFHDFLAMPLTMRRLAWVQIFTWLGFFCMWLYFGVAVARNIFGGTPGTPEYDQGIAWAGNCFAMYSAVCFAFSFGLPPLAKRLGRRLTHALCLLAGAAGLISVAAIDDKYLLLVPMVGVGIAWASTLAMPYAILAGSLPAGKTGIYMGIFNFFIVIPEILAALGFGTLLERLLTDESTLVAHLGGDNRLAVVVIGGLSLAVAAALCSIVVEPEGYPMRPTDQPVHAEDPSTLSPQGRGQGEG